MLFCNMACRVASISMPYTFEKDLLNDNTLPPTQAVKSIITIFFKSKHKNVDVKMKIKYNFIIVQIMSVKDVQIYYYVKKKTF